MTAATTPEEMATVAGETAGTGADGDGSVQEEYGWSPEVQRRGVALCLRDPTAYAQLGPEIFHARFVGHAPLKPVAEALYTACAANGGEPPSPELLRDLVEERAVRLRPAAAEASRRELALVLETPLPDARLVRDRMVEWAREAALRDAVLRGATMLDSKAVHNGAGGELVRLIQDALAVGAAAPVRSLAREPEEVEALLNRREVRLVPTGLKALDDALGGGVEPGLHVVAGDPKLGKTSFLTQVAIGAAARGFVAWYVSAEVTERPLVRRAVSAAIGWNRKELVAAPRRAAQTVAAALRHAGGDVLVDYQPAFSVSWLAAQLRQLEGRGHRIGVVVVDYLDLLRPARQQEAPRFELAEISKDLRTLAVAAGVPIWTAKKVNRKAVAKPIVTKADLAECFDVAYNADNVFALCATEAERQRDSVVCGEKTPILRLYYAAGREEGDEYTVGAWRRDNERQRWTQLKGYVERFEREVLGRRGGGGAGGIS